MRGGSFCAVAVATAMVPLSLAVVATTGCHTKTDDCDTGCQHTFALWPHWCVCSGECAIDGVAVPATACCPLGTTCTPEVGSQQTLRIPIPWQELWGAHDLYVYWTGVDPQDVTLLFDGVPATGCAPPPALGPHTWYLICPALTPDVHTLEIRYDGALTPSNSVSVAMLDPTCGDYSRGCL